MAEMVVALFYHAMNIDPANPEWEERDRFILSKGHAVPMEYAVKMDLKYFDGIPEEKRRLRAVNSLLQGHSSRAETVVHGRHVMDNSAGSLGMGFTQAIGYAHLSKAAESPAWVYCVLGDGELQEGVVWECVRFAADNPANLTAVGKRYELDNLIVFVDRNRAQNDDHVSVYTDSNEKMERIWQAWGWHVQTINGHDIGAILEGIERAKLARGAPSVIIGDTVKAREYFYCTVDGDPASVLDVRGRVAFSMEGDPSFHGAQPPAEETEKVLRFLEARLEHGTYPRDKFYDKRGTFEVKKDV